MEESRSPAYLPRGRRGPERCTHDGSATDCTVVNLGATGKNELESEFKIERESMFSTSTKLGSKKEGSGRFKA